MLRISQLYANEECKILGGYKCEVQVVTHIKTYADWAEVSDGFIM